MVSRRHLGNKQRFWNEKLRKEKKSKIVAVSRAKYSHRQIIIFWGFLLKVGFLCVFPLMVFWGTCIPFIQIDPSWWTYMGKASQSMVPQRHLEGEQKKRDDEKWWEKYHSLSLSLSRFSISSLSQLPLLCLSILSPFFSLFAVSFFCAVFFFSVWLYKFSIYLEDP